MKRVRFLVSMIAAMFLMTTYGRAEVKGTYGGAERIRYELWVNNTDLNSGTKDNRSFFRFKTSLWGDVRVKGLDVADEAGLYLKLTNEFKPYTYYMVTTAPNNRKGKSFDISEMIVDNLYFDLKKPLQSPWSFRIGRQDLMTYGEGFLLMDGTPVDGSRTMYFNAAKATLDVDDKNSIDVIYIDDTRFDRWLPGFNKTHNPFTALNNVDEFGYVVYGKSKAIDHLSLEPYYIYKVEDGEKANTTTVRVNTLGSYAKYDFSKAVALRGQAAYQFGESNNANVQGVGGTLFLDDKLDRTMKPMLSGGVIYLSGDDKGTEDIEGWNPLFSRYPWMSEIFANLLTTETGRVSYWTNMQIYRLEASVNPTDKCKATVRYNYLRANESGSGTSFSDGRERGHLPQLKLDYTFSKNVTAYVLGEYFLPGNFYAPANRDPAVFLRTELMVKF